MRTLPRDLPGEGAKSKVKNLFKHSSVVFPPLLHPMKAHSKGLCCRQGVCASRRTPIFESLSATLACGPHPFLAPRTKVSNAAMNLEVASDADDSAWALSMDSARFKDMLDVPYLSVLHTLPPFSVRQPPCKSEPGEVGPPTMCRMLRTGTPRLPSEIVQQAPTTHGAMRIFGLPR